MNLNPATRKKILERDNFSCQKCGFQSSENEDLEIHHISPKVFSENNSEENLITLCSICHKHAPDSEKEFKKYILEKIDWKSLETFRKSNYSIQKKTTQGMLKKHKQGLHITKAPKGYKLVEKQLIIDQEQAENVKQIFQEFLETNTSLTKLAKKNGMTTSGIIKLLKNTTYTGKVKFDSVESQGTHEPIINEETFKKVQEKLKNI